MATIVNIFGKLYTFLRRPQAEQNGADESRSLGQDTDSTTQKGAVAAGVEKPEVSQQPDSSEQSVQNGGALKKKMEQLDKVMTDSTASSDWEHIPEASAESQKMVDSVDRKSSAELCDNKPKIQLNDSTLSGTDIDAAYSIYADQVEDNSSKEKHGGNTATNTAIVNEANSASEKKTSPDAGKSSAVTDKETAVQTEAQNDGNVREKNAKSEKEGPEGKKSKDGKKGKVNGDEVAVSPRPEKAIDEKEFTSYVDFVYKNTEHGIQIKAKDLFYKLGYEKGADTDRVGDAVMGQYQLAKSRNNWPWVKDARYFAELFFAPDWIDKNLPHRDVKSNRKNRPSKKSKCNVNEHFENPSGMCRDFRLKENPDIQTVSANAAGDNAMQGKPSQSQGIAANHGDAESAITGKHGNVDEFVTDYTEQVIQQAMKMAIGDGLSESAIMEVIDDVTSADRITTPHKRSKLAKLDVSRTPRCRPDQLALGFNYHSDLVVQQSPKTVRGEIIPLDTLPQPRKRPEQLAVSFNYLAEQLVKESPKTETGEVIIPGVTTTPRRLARDKLAVGFNYNSDLVVQQSPKTVRGEIIPLDTRPQPRERPEQLAVSFNYLAEQLVKESPKTETGEVIIPSVTTTPRRLASDKLAVGFNYHSDIIAKDSPSKGNPNESAEVPDDKFAKNQKNDSHTLMNGVHNGYSEDLTYGKLKSAKRSISDTFAVGFSYNSDQIIIESLDEINGNVPNDNNVSSLIEDAVIGEGRNIVEVIDEVPATGLPAGSAW